MFHGSLSALRHHLEAHQAGELADREQRIAAEDGMMPLSAGKPVDHHLLHVAVHRAGLCLLLAALETQIPSSP
jgi:hypothetical protein